MTRKEMRGQKNGWAKSLGHLLLVLLFSRHHRNAYSWQKRPWFATIECLTTEVCWVVHECSINFKLIQVPSSLKLCGCSSTQKQEIVSIEERDGFHIERNGFQRSFHGVANGAVFYLNSPNPIISLYIYAEQ